MKTKQTKISISSSSTSIDEQRKLGQTLRFFFLLGATGFGGPLSLVQSMRQHFVDRLKMISDVEFDQTFTMIKAMPGPIAFQMAIYLGFRFFSLLGAIGAGLGLVLPSFVMILLLGVFSQAVKDLSLVQSLLQGFLFSVTAVILMSLRGMVVASRSSPVFWVILAFSLILSWNSVLPEPVLIIGFGILVAIAKHQKNNFKIVFKIIVVGVALVISVKAMAGLSILSQIHFNWGSDLARLSAIFKSCFYGGSFVFGTGLAILPVLRGFFVDQYHWLTLSDFNTAVVFGQMTPGPVTITASYLGYLASGFWGAVFATLGVFLMPFIHMVTWFPYAVRWLSRQKWISSFLLGATAAVVASIVVTVIRMNLEHFREWLFWLVYLGNLVLLIWRPKTSYLAVILGSGCLTAILAGF